ncbi:MAG: TPM domain-containing protein, partial [Flavitalea sp.]
MINSRMNSFGKMTLWLLILLPFITQAQHIPAKPNPPRLVNDFANVLSDQEEAILENKLKAFDDSTSIQIAIVTVKTLEGNPIEEYSLKILRDWGIGNKTTNNGALIVAAIDDRQIRIETGYGLEGAIPDITANQIIRNDITPAFRSSNYFQGLDNATNSILEAARGEYKAPEGYAGRGRKGSGIPFTGIIIIIIIIAIIANRGGGIFSGSVASVSPSP